MKAIIGKVKDHISKSPEVFKSVYGDAVDKLKSGLKKISDLGAEAKKRSWILPTRLFLSYLY